MAEATFTLRAVDSTKAAFASVQNSLTKIHSTTKIIGTGMAGLFGFQAAISGAQRLNRVMEDAEKSGAKVGLSKDEIDSLTFATNLYDKAIENIQITAGKAASMVASAIGRGKTEIDSAIIRNDRIRDQVKLITEEIRKQNVENSLSLGNEGMKIAVLRDELQAAKNRSKMANDDLSRSQADLEFARAKGQLSSALNRMQEHQSDLIQEQKDLRIQLNSSIGLERNESKLINDLLAARLDITREIKDSQDGTDQGLSDENMFREERNRIDKELIPLLQNRYSLEKSIGGVVADSFQTAILEGGKFIDVLRDMLAQIVKLVFFETVTKRLASSLSSMLIGNPLADVTTGVAKSLAVIPALAVGGPVNAGSPYVVGEKGPELFVPHSSGSIVPNGAMGSSGGGAGGVTVNYNIAAGVSRAELVPILEQERRRLKAEIPDMVRRGGSYRSAFA
jgi:predicted transcriptional regulator